MDLSTGLFVGLLCLIAFFVTANVRRDFLDKERRLRESQRQAQHTRLRRKP